MLLPGVVVGRLRPSAIRAVQGDDPDSTHIAAGKDLVSEFVEAAKVYVVQKLRMAASNITSNITTHATQTADADLERYITL